MVAERHLVDKNSTRMETEKEINSMRIEQQTTPTQII